MTVEIAFMTYSDKRELTYDRPLPHNQDVMTHTYVAPKFQKHDKDLFATKWFDYRFMSSFDATMLYIDSFKEIGRRIYAREIDFQRAEYIHFPTSQEIMRKLVENDTKAKSKLTGYWRGRQVADALGMPYPLYIEWAMTFRMRAWQRVYLPNPQQLYGMYEVEKIQTKWADIQTSRLHIGEHHAYLMQNYRGLEAQDDHHAWIIAQAQLRKEFPEHLARFVLDDLLPVEKARAALTEYEAERFERCLD